MVYVRHVKGGSITFVADGRMVTMTVGAEGDVPDQIFRRYATRFQRIDPPPPAAIRASGIPHATTAMSADNVEMRFVARHRGHGRWVVWDTIAHDAVSDAMDRADAERAAAEHNAEANGEA
jgi:hypothetical protein